MDNIIQLAIKYNINRNIELLEYIDEKLMLAVNKYFLIIDEILKETTVKNKSIPY